jgi:signal transduction histidine kinase
VSAPAPAGPRRRSPIRRALDALGRTRIRSKLLLLAMFVAVTSILLVSVAYGLLAAQQSRQALSSELRAIAEVLAANNAAAVVFEDRAAAEQTLRNVRTMTDVRAARLLRPDGSIFAAVPPPAEHAPWRIGPSVSPVTFFEDVAEISVPLEIDGQQVGLLQLRAGLDRLAAERRSLLLVGAAVVLLTGLVAYVLSRALGRVIAAPLEDLTGAIRRVSEAGDYTARVERPHEDDELGRVIDGFNRMIARIHAQHAELERYGGELEDRVAQRTRDLAEANRRLQTTVHQLELAKREAEGASEAKSLFLANMSHELRTPLNAVIGFADLLYNEFYGAHTDSRYRTYARDIRDSGQHLLAIINDVLDVARMETGGFRMSEATVSVDQILTPAVRMIESDIAERGLELIRNPAPAGLSIRADPVRLRQVVLNLLSNAAKFTSARGRITVSTERTANGGLAIAVADTGIGIAAPDIPKILEPFGQVATAFHRNHQGVGLGLALCKSIAEQHGGTLAIDSTVGEGTRVTVTLPPDRVHAEASGHDPAPEAGAAS